MEIIHIPFEILPSTNQYAKDNIHSFSKKDLTVISAQEQTEGKGQYGRSWHSPKGNIYVTFCFFLKGDQDPFLWTRLMAEVIQKILFKWKIDASIKWPNDLLVNGKKIVGILSETISCPDEMMGIIIGVGMNLNLSKEAAEVIEKPVTSVFLETNQIIDPQLVIKYLTKTFYDRAFQ